MIVAADAGRLPLADDSVDAAFGAALRRRDPAAWERDGIRIHALLAEMNGKTVKP